MGNCIRNEGGGALRGNERREDKNTFAPLLLNLFLLRERYGIFGGW